jgi:phosphoglycerate dehydrogenase-like enzyme
VAAAREAKVIFGFALPLRVAALAPRLCWVETPATGFDQLNGTGVLERRDLAVTTIGGLFAPWVAEHVFALLLGLWRQLDRFAGAQHRQEWIGRGVEVRELRDATMAIVGLGNIGQAVARAAAAFGMRVVGTRRRAAAVPPGVARVYPRDALRSLLAEADVVVLAVAGTPETVHLIGAAELAAMRAEAVLINVARHRGPFKPRWSMRCATTASPSRARRLVREPLAPDSPLWTPPT